MEPPATPGQAFLVEVRRRRADLLESMRAVEQALSAPAAGREQHWAERVHVALVELAGDFLLTPAGEGGFAEDVDRVRDGGTAMLARLLRHRRHGSDLIYEAYQADIGGET